MYIINHGKVDVRSGDESLIVLDDGMFFGEQALIKHTTRNADVISLSYCDLYILEKDDFMNLIERFPELIKNMDTTLHDVQEHQKEHQQQKEKVESNIDSASRQKLKLAS